MLDASTMIIEVISTEPRAPSAKKQAELIREDGTVPEKTIRFPADRDDFNFFLYRGDGDIVAIAHPKVLGSPQKVRAVLEGIARAEATVKLPNSEPMNVSTKEGVDAFLALVATTPWGRGTRKQLRNPGRPPKHKQPTADQKATYCRMWAKPNEFAPRDIRSLASEELGRDVAHWELKHWCGDKRGSNEEHD